MQVTYSQFCNTIASDYNIQLEEKHKTYIVEFPIKNGKRKINSFFDAIIVDKEGNEYPYMLSLTIRNEERLIDFDYIYITRPKSLSVLLKEASLTLKTESCKICEGGGWYSNGIRYYYKDIFCEI